MSVMAEVGDAEAKSIHTAEVHAPLVLFTARSTRGQRQGLLRVAPAADELTEV